MIADNIRDQNKMRIGKNTLSTLGLIKHSFTISTSGRFGGFISLEDVFNTAFGFIIIIPYIFKSFTKA
jgi:hypothetical protein